MVGPPLRPRPPKQLADVGRRLPCPSRPAWAALHPLFSLQGRSRRVFGELWPAPQRGARTREAAPSLPVAPLFRPQLGAGAGAGGAGGRAACARRGGAAGAGLAPYLVLIITQSVSVHSGRARRSPQVQSAKSPGKKSAPQVSVSSMGARGSAPRSAPSAWHRLAPRGSETGAARPPLFLPSTLHPPPPPRPRPAATPAAAGLWPRARSATLRVTRPAAAIGAGRPGGAGSRRRRPWARRLPWVAPGGRPARECAAAASCCPGLEPRGARSRVWVPSARTLRPGRAARVWPQPGPGSGGKGRGLGASVPSPQTLPPPSGTSPADEMPRTCP